MTSIRVVGRALDLVMVRFGMDSNPAFDYVVDSAAQAAPDPPDYARRPVDGDDIP